MFHFDFLKLEIKNRTLPDTGEVTLFWKILVEIVHSKYALLNFFSHSFEVVTM